MILILISYGYSIVKPRLRSIHRKTCTFSIIYFVIYFCERVHATSRDYGFLGHLVILIPIAVLNAMAASWIIFNLFSMLTNLAKKRKQAELTLYRQFSFSLAVISSVAFLSWVFVILFYRTAKCIKNTNQSLYEFSIRCGFIASIHVILAILWSPGAKNTSIDDIALNSYVNDDTQDFNELNDSLAASDHFKSSKHESNEPSSADSSSQFSKDINFEQKADRLLRQLDKIS
ncbi:hypothetical protein GJ496_008829 [Pomphorhynchus laevis]|nr:hypothetical protein GJ496_008829 [Pomphorhynchus laevis]